MTMSSTLTFNAAPGLFENTISTNQQELNLATYATGQGWDGSSEASITISSGVYIWSDNIATPALTTGDFPGGLTLIVEGFIIGKGGKGGGAAIVDESPVYVAPEAGGVAISLGCDCTIEGGASAYIGGGGGGGGGVAGQSGGGGAGGGAGGDAGGLAVDVFGGTGGAVGATGGDGNENNDTTQAPGSGGGSGGGGAGELF